MIADDRSRTATSPEEPTPPPVDPEDRPTIEPSDALPTEASSDPVTALEETRTQEPTPPPVDPADRPTITPSDALPTKDR